MFAKWTLLNAIVVFRAGKAHLIDDSLFGFPVEFGFSSPQAQTLAGLFSALIGAILILMGSGLRAGFVGGAFLGVLLGPAGWLKQGQKILEPGQ